MWALQRKLLLLLLTLTAWQVKGQNPWKLFISEAHQQALPPYQISFTNPLDRQAEIRKVLAVWHNQGFAAAGIDSTQQVDSLLHVFIHKGDLYTIKQVRQGNVSAGAWRKLQRSKVITQSGTLSAPKLKQVYDQVLDYYDENGHPFATVQLDSIQFIGNDLHASLRVDPGDIVKIDSIVVRGNARISNVYLFNHLGIKPGVPYNEQSIRKLNNRINELPFLQSTKMPQVQFTDLNTKVVLYLQNKKANQFDGFVGFQPDDVSGKIRLTGDLRVKLLNALGYGESIDLNWRALQAQTQDLKARAAYPYLFNTPLGAEYKLRVFKRDTSFVETDQFYAIGLNVSRILILKVFYNYKSSNLLNKSLPVNGAILGDVKNNQYGLGLTLEDLDFRLNPRKGVQASIDASAGNRKITGNSLLQQGENQPLLNSPQYRLQAYLTGFVPLGKQGTLKTSLSAQSAIGEALLNNEWWRFGGLRSLRGFDEESLSASQVGIASVEYRFLLDTYSFLYGFVDGCWYERRNAFEKTTDTPLGFGAGAAFETKAGIFSINYALGSQRGNSINVRSGKIHFGIISVF